MGWSGFPFTFHSAFPTTCGNKNRSSTVCQHSIHLKRKLDIILDGSGIGPCIGRNGGILSGCSCDFVTAAWKNRMLRKFMKCTIPQIKITLVSCGRFFRSVRLTVAALWACLFRCFQTRWISRRMRRSATNDRNLLIGSSSDKWNSRG
jgi:hypothetical protein